MIDIGHVKRLVVKHLASDRHDGFRVLELMLVARIASTSVIKFAKYVFNFGIFQVHFGYFSLAYSIHAHLVFMRGYSQGTIRKEELCMEMFVRATSFCMDNNVLLAIV